MVGGEEITRRPTAHEAEWTEEANSFALSLDLPDVFATGPDQGSASASGKRVRLDEIHLHDKRHKFATTASRPGGLRRGEIGFTEVCAWRAAYRCCAR